MTALNSESTIEHAVKSTLQSLPRDAELVVLDDGSTDSTGEILAQIEDKRLSLHTGTHSGVALGLNRLINATDSNFIARMDADDICLPGRFGRQLEAINHGADIVFTTCWEFGPKKHHLSPKAPQRLEPDAFPLQLLLTNPVSHPTMLASRACIENIGGYRVLPAEDYDLWLRLAVAGARMTRLASPGLLYRKHPAQVTASSKWRLASWSNDEIAESYAKLSMQLLGREFLRLTTLAIRSDISHRECDDLLRDFRGRFTAAASELSAWDSFRLQQKCASRIAWVTRFRAGQT